MHIPFDAWITVLEMYPEEIIRNAYSYQYDACVEAGATWEETSGPSPQFGCEPKSALKHCLLKKHNTAFPRLHLRINIIGHLSNKKNTIQTHRYTIILTWKICLCVFKLGGIYLSMIIKKTEIL